MKSQKSAFITTLRTNIRTSAQTKYLDALCYILDDGKQNDSGHLELVGAIDHRDPALSLFTALAELALVILRETRVDNELPRGTREWLKITDTQELMTMQLLQVSSEAAGGGINRAKNVYTTCAKRVKQLLQEYQKHASQENKSKLKKKEKKENVAQLSTGAITAQAVANAAAEEAAATTTHGRINAELKPDQLSIDTTAAQTVANAAAEKAAADAAALERAAAEQTVDIDAVQHAAAINADAEAAATANNLHEEITRRLPVQLLPTSPHGCSTFNLSQERPLPRAILPPMLKL